MTNADSWVLGHLSSEAPSLVFGTGALFLASFVNFRTGAQLRNAIQASPDEAQSVICRSLMFFGLGAVAGCIRTLIVDSTVERLRASLAVEVFAARLRTEPLQEASTPNGQDMRLEKLEKGEGGAADVDTLAAAMNSDVATCSESVQKLQNLARYTCSVLGGTVAMFTASWKLSAAVWPLLVIGAFHGARAGAKQAGKSAQVLSLAREEALNFAEERLQHRDLVRWFCRDAAEAAEFKQKCEACVAIASKAARSRGLAHLVFDFIAKGLMVGLASLGSVLVHRGELTAGELTSFFFHGSFLGLGLYGLVNLMPELTVARHAARRLHSYVLAAPEVKEENSPKLSSTLPLAVRFQAVSFAYAGRHILRNFSLDVAAGHVVAIVGPSGCGKSTALSLLLRDYDAESGKVLIGGEDIRNFSRQDARKLLRVLPQQPALLGASVAEAIKFGAVVGPEPVRAEIEQAAQAACAHSFICARPGDYDSFVGRGGQLLSGGERQRLSMARALIRQAPILVLDEPTSALDAATAAALTEALLAPRANRPTTIVATHSLALIRACDSVAVMSEDGQVVQRGTFSELIADTSGPMAAMLKAGRLEDDLTTGR